MDRMNEDLKYPVEALGHFGLHLTKIPERAEKTADLQGTDGSATFVVEVKSKEDSDKYLERREAAAQTGEIVDDQHPISRRNVMSGILRAASEQLSSTASAEDYRMVVFNARGHHAEVQMEQAEATFYGSVDGLDLDTQETFSLYFFDHNECSTLRESIDALFLMTDWSHHVERKARLCVNPFSLRSRDLRKSAFAQAISPYIGDPLEEERTGKALIVDSDVDRSDKKEVLRHLQKKYRRPRLIDLSGMTHYEASVFIPKS